MQAETSPSKPSFFNYNTASLTNSLAVFLNYLFGEIVVVTRSLIKAPSVPGPEYFEVGCMKVINASK